MPKTVLGKWSVGFVFLFFLLLATGMFVVSVLGQQGGETFFDNPVISIPMLSAGAAGILAFFTGATDIIKYKERSILVIIATVIGLLITWFVVGEILSPH